MRYLIAYVTALLAMGVLDALWLGVIAKDLYRDALGHLLADEVRIGAAIAFYLLYAGGVVIFATVPALKAASAVRALGQGGLFGFFAYMTYDLTNLATLRDWPLRIVVIDIGWGVFLSACTATAAYLAAAKWQARASLKGPT
jgi:uncharacterized membrane protein